MSSDELWQAYDEQGRPTRGITREEANLGELHGASHLWIWRKTSHGLQFLLQKRASDKRTWPGYWDISTAGHIDVGEEPLPAMLREAHEEIGLTLQPEDLKLLFVFRQFAVDPAAGAIENEFNWVYGYQVNGDLQVQSDHEEVETTKWVDLADVQRLISGADDDQIVPQGEPYFLNLFTEIKRLAEL